MDADALELPPHYESVVVERADSALAEAARRARASAPEGTLVWVGEQYAPDPRLSPTWGPTPGNLHCALILQPEMPVARAIQLAPLATLATGLAIAELVLPGTVLGYRWPGTVTVNDHEAASLALVAPAAGRGHVEWLVAALSVRAARDAADDDDMPASLSRAADGIVPADRVLTLFARFFLKWINRWAEEGFEPVHRAWAGRVRADDGSAARVSEDGALEIPGGETRSLAEYYGIAP